jgi:hypothetical protein
MKKLTLILRCRSGNVYRVPMTKPYEPRGDLDLDKGYAGYVLQAWTPQDLFNPNGQIKR